MINTNYILSQTPLCALDGTTSKNIYKKKHNLHQIKRKIRIAVKKHISGEKTDIFVRRDVSKTRAKLDRIDPFWRNLTLKMPLHNAAENLLKITKNAGSFRPDDAGIPFCKPAGIGVTAC